TAQRHFVGVAGERRAARARPRRVDRERVAGQSPWRIDQHEQRRARRWWTDPDSRRFVADRENRSAVCDRRRDRLQRRALQQPAFYYELTQLWRGKRDQSTRRYQPGRYRERRGAEGLRRVGDLWLAGDETRRRPHHQAPAPWIPAMPA